MNIREFEISDINDCINDFMQTFNNEPWNEKWSFERADEYINDVFNSPKVVGFVLCEDDKNVAYALCFKRYWWNSDDRYKLLLELFFIKPDYQRKGYGGVLLEHIEDYAKENGIRGIMLYTQKNKPCFDFYAKNGYVVMDNVPNVFKALN
ncbi:MAG: GNAT family N-acetyltransferase [Defluviitaleaceae bacterium]|nr:GNAT family N-acetyltransferase [Defluviitaleaceae bacterium]